MKLYYAPGACSLAPHIVAVEAGLPLELHKVEFGPGGKSVDGRDFAGINPKGAVPTLELDDGQILTENQVILQYLGSLAPDSRLGPPPLGIERWRFLELLNFIATELHKTFAILFKPDLSSKVREPVVAMIRQRLGLLQEMLADKSYLTGDRFTIADAYAYVMLTWADLHRIDLSPWPGLQSYKQRVEAREGVRQARREEGLEPSSAPRGKAPDAQATASGASAG
jgi:glutathione S-transferase